MQLSRPMPHQSMTLQARPSFDQFGRGLDRILWDSGQQLRIWAPSKITLLDRAPTFYSNHVLWFTCSTNESWTLHLFFATVLTPSDAPVDEYHLTLWQWAQKQLRIQSSLSFNGDAGCKVIDHLHLCRVSLQPAWNYLLQMSLSIVQLLCLYMHVSLFVSISCSDFISVIPFFI